MASRLVAVPCSQLATRQQDSLQAIVNKHVQDPALRELNSTQTSTERGLQRWEQAHLVSALDVLNEYQRSRRARVFGSLGDFGPSFRRSYKNDPRTRMCELLKSWLRANANCHSLPEEEVRSMCGLCRDILSHPQLFPAKNPQSFMKSIADVYDHLQWQLQEVLEKDRSCAELAQRILSMSRNLVTDTITYLLLGPSDLKDTDGMPSMEVVKLWQSLPNEGHPMPHRKDPALQKLMSEAWQSHVGMLIAALLRAPWCVRLFAGADAESSTRLLALEDGKAVQMASLQSLLKEAENSFDAGHFKGSGLVGALRSDAPQRRKWIQALTITSDIMFLLGEVMVQFHRISDGLGDFGMIRVSPWLHPVLDSLVEKVLSLKSLLESLNHSLDVAYVLARARGQKVQKPAPSEKMCFRAREAIQRALLAGKGSHADQLLQIADELRARSAPERLPHLAKGLGDATLSLSSVLSSEEFRRHVGDAFPELPKLGDYLEVARDAGQGFSRAIEGPKASHEKMLQIQDKENLSTLSQTNTTVSVKTQSFSDRESCSSCCSVPKVSEPDPGALKFEVYRLLNDTRHDLRCIELREGELLVYDAKSLSQVKYRVQIPDGMDRVLLKSDTILEMSFTVLPATDRKKVMKQKDYIFEFISAEEADVFCEEIWNQGVR